MRAPTIVIGRLLCAGALMLIGCGAESDDWEEDFESEAYEVTATTLKLCVAQFDIESTLSENENKIKSFISDAASESCTAVVLPEAALSWTSATKSAIDAAIGRIKTSAGQNDIYVIFGAIYKDSDAGAGYNRAYAIDPDGAVLMTYKKSAETPTPFFIEGVKTSAFLCADRWKRDIADLPAVTQGSRNHHRPVEQLPKRVDRRSALAHARPNGSPP